MATARRSSVIRPVLLVCLALGLLGAVCGGRVPHHRESRPSHLRLGSSDRAVEGDIQHEKDVSSSSTTSRWKLLAKRLNTILRMMRLRSQQYADTSDNSLPSDVKLNRVRRSYDPDDQLAQEQAIVDDVHEVEQEYGPGRKIAQQREIAREIDQIERDAGLPTRDEKLAQEQEIAREIAQIEEQYGPAHKIAQQKEIAREIEDAEIQAGRAEADRRFEQQREIQREIEEIERKAGVPSDAEKLEREREIARDIATIESEARQRQKAQEQTVAGDIRKMVDKHLGRKTVPKTSANDDSSSSSEGSDEASDVTDDITDNFSDNIEEDPIYDDAFGGDMFAHRPFDGDEDNSAEGASSAQGQPQDAMTSATQGQVKDVVPGESHVQVAHSSWQVTVMTVIMCAIVGVVLLIVVGTWYRHLGFRPLVPSKPQTLLLDDDEQTVYNRTTQPEPREVGTYSPLT